ncbi:hypothetical protein HAX54_011602 [Datura stramonium]|uniref:Uncharacterized protein n=1 Tax=Datura stramonium TaxID=4076 RepID=A0ABS8TJY6_DATST|nr:hypothetical protein [Datura stramonium]
MTLPKGQYPSWRSGLSATLDQCGEVSSNNNSVTMFEQCISYGIALSEVVKTRECVKMSNGVLKSDKGVVEMPQRSKSSPNPTN